MRAAVVVSGWHFPLHFYEAMSKQVRPKGWSFDFFCISHRDPIHAAEEKKDRSFDDSVRGKIDSLLYKELATVDKLKAIGWDYKLHPNTVGDWGNSNQWLDEHDYSKYDLLLFSHDDNFIIHDRVLADVIEDASFSDWDILANSVGMPPGSVRGSFEFFKPGTMVKMGGKFDLSYVTLTRDGITTSSESIAELNDWNNMTPALTRQIEQHQFKVGYLSPAYRVSAYCIEGERGYISNTHGANTKYEDAGLQYLHDNNII